MNNSEEKKNTLWRAVLAVSTVLIIIIAAFFIVKLFTANPLEGRWVSEEQGITMTIRGSSTLSVNSIEGDESAAVTAKYEVDKEEKTFTIHGNDSADVSQEEDADDTGNIDVLEQIEGTYDYSVDDDVLTLTEREYGEQMIFELQ